ncbi:PREDICTED: putative B3 domain-containing protein At1g78640 [Fragaria vesca subsp. vesca]|uniref:putative B3 domain-containing protein At1g78640 n=1 Tax=Fragaria vesca subsp. vesca TaxID=101020 RepID=UPI0002C33C2E|nr:PREDICTED: putative B3 domain-containing protein At1g78640 [Fragaria vesca subsp. vesca]
MEVAMAETPTLPWSAFFDPDHTALARKRRTTEDELDGDDDDDARHGMKFANELRHRDAWYKKRLNDGDVSKSRDMLPVSKSWVVDQVLPFLDESAAERIKRGQSERVIVKDCELDTFHVLYLKKQKTGRFVFVGRWRDDFVIRRNLKEGDNIGLCWQQEESMFSFTAFYRK